MGRSPYDSSMLLPIAMLELGLNFGFSKKVVKTPAEAQLILWLAMGKEEQVV